MANTFTQIHIHGIFGVQNRLSLIQESWKDELYKYITGIIQNNHHKLIAVNGIPDHVHVLFGMRPTQSLSDLMKDIKGSSSKWINQKRIVKGRFSWQAGFGGFSYSKSQIPRIAGYIENQQEHHKKKSFIDEYVEILEAYGIDYDSRYIFKPVV